MRARLTRLVVTLGTVAMAAFAGGASYKPF